MTNLFVNQKMYSVIILLVVSAFHISAQQKVSFDYLKETRVPEDIKYNIATLDADGAIQPKIQIFPKKVVFYNDQGKVIQTKEYAQFITAIPSSKHNYLQIVRTTEGIETKQDKGTSEIELFSGDGKSIWRKSRQIYYEGRESRFVISDQGKSVEQRRGNQFIFYDKAGEKINEHVFHEGTYLDPALTDLKFSDDGNFVLLKINLPSEGMSGAASENDRRTRRENNQSTAASTIEAGSAELTLFDSDGNQQWQFLPKNRRLGQAFSSPENKYIVISGGNSGSGNSSATTYILDRKTGEIKWEHPGINAASTRFYKHLDSEYVLIKSSRSAGIINMTNGDLKRLYSVSKKEEGILGTAISPSLGLIALAKTYLEWTEKDGRKYPSYRESSLLFYDLSGKMLSQEPIYDDYLENLEGSFTEKMFFSDKDKELIIYSTNLKSYKHYELHID